MADQIAISFWFSGVKFRPKGVSGNPGNPPKTAPVKSLYVATDGHADPDKLECLRTKQALWVVLANSL